MFTNGRLGIFDTKSKNNFVATKTKEESLQQYIKEENKNLFGGTVILF